MPQKLHMFKGAQNRIVGIAQTTRFLFKAIIAYTTATLL